MFIKEKNVERMGEHRNCKLAQMNLNTDLDQGGLILLYLNWTSLYFFGGVSEFFQTHRIQFLLMLFLATWLTGKKKIQVFAKAQGEFLWKMESG